LSERLRLHRLTTVGLLTFALAVALAAPAGGQQKRAVEQAPTQDGDQIRLGTELVMLDVSVVDRANRPIYDIGKERFSVLEDGVPQQIDFFSKELAPVSLGLAIDTSGSMRSKLESVIQAVTNLVQGNRPQDETAVIQFKDTVELIEEFTADTGDVKDALDGLISNGQTSLLDAIILAGDYVQKEGRHRRKALIIVTDGLERGSFYSFDDLVDHAREQDVRLYLIGFTQDLDSQKGLFKKSTKTKAEQLLNKIATETGGRSFFPKDISELSGITEQIALDLRTVYAIGYYPTNQKRDGTYRKVDVRVANPDGRSDEKLVARTRAGYTSEKE
jgi:Ca-activated chloride channel family protein